MSYDKYQYNRLPAKGGGGDIFIVMERHEESLLFSQDEMRQPPAACLQIEKIFVLNGLKWSQNSFGWFEC